MPDVRECQHPQVTLTNYLLFYTCISSFFELEYYVFILLIIIKDIYEQDFSVRNKTLIHYLVYDRSVYYLFSVIAPFAGIFARKHHMLITENIILSLTKFLKMYTLKFNNKSL